MEFSDKALEETFRGEYTMQGRTRCCVRGSRQTARRASGVRIGLGDGWGEWGRRACLSSPGGMALPPALPPGAHPPTHPLPPPAPPPRAGRLHARQASSDCLFASTALIYAAAFTTRMLSRLPDSLAGPQLSMLVTAQYALLAIILSVFVARWVGLPAFVG